MHFKTFIILVMGTLSMLNLPCLAKQGSFLYRKIGVHDGNNVRTTFFNYGLVGRMTASDYGGEWPINSGHEYIGDINILIGAEIVTANGHTVHSVEVNNSPRGNNEYSPDGTTFWGFEPLAGFDNPDTNECAVSHKKYTWPPYWPDKLDDPIDPGWPGHWNGYFGKDQFNATQESYFVMDDSNDKEFEFYPDSTDSTRGGLGLEVKVRGFQWDFPYELEDVIFWIYDIVNEGTTNYDKVVFGTLVGTIIGGDGDTEDDCAWFDTLYDVGYAWDWDGIGNTGWSPVGCTGYAFLQTPDDLGLTSFYYFHPFNKVKLRNDEQLWDCMEPGYFNVTQQNVDGDFISGCGYFQLNAGETKRIITAIVFGDGLNNLLINVQNAKSFVTGNFEFNTQPINLSFPVGGEILSGEENISWENEGATSVDIYYSSDKGETWTLITSGEENDGEYLWNTQSVPDGINYLIYIVAKDENGVVVGADHSDSVFIINNPGNAIPEIEIISPKAAEYVSGDFNVTWDAGDADGDTLSIDIFVSNNDGLSWELVAQDEVNDGCYGWHTPNSPNGIHSILRIVAKDATTYGEDESKSFTLHNYRVSIADSNIVHVQGSGTGTISVHIADSSAITDHLYELTFNDTLEIQKTYSVYDLTAHQFVIQDAPHLAGDGEGPLFDGLRLLINDDTLVYNDSISGWISGNSNYEIQVTLQIDPFTKGIPIPADFQIRFFDNIVDTSSAYSSAMTNFTSVPTTFSVWDITNNHKAKFAYYDYGNNGMSDNDLIILLTEQNHTLVAGWAIIFVAPSGVSPIPPVEGDTLLIHIDKPFTEQDHFLFSTTEIVSIEVPSKQQNLFPTVQLFQNYPNPFNSSATVNYLLPTASEVRLKIYNIAGQTIKTLIDKYQDSGYHTVVWDRQDDDGLVVAPGVYFCQLIVSHGSKSLLAQTQKMIILK